MLKSEIVKQIKNRFDDETKCAAVENLLSLFSNPLRFKILCALVETDFSVTEIAEIAESKISNISQQLKILTLAGYLSKKREGKLVFYRLEDEKVRSMIRFMHELFDIPAVAEQAV